ncbi:MAG TPA: hypothetical protein VH968_00715 [Gaiellaceae bacterium]
MKAALGAVAMAMLFAGCGGGEESTTLDGEVEFRRPMTVVDAARWAERERVTLTEIVFVHRAQGQEQTFMFRPERRFDAEELSRRFRAETLPSLRGVARSLERAKRERLAVEAAIEAVENGAAGVERVRVCPVETCPSSRLDSSP